MFAKQFIFISLSLVLFSSSALALPWDQDLFKQQSFKANEMSRAPAEGTVPRGYKPFTMTVEEAATNLKNPVPADRDSVWSGQRLYNSNCYTCHGKKGEGNGPVGPQMAVPSLLDDFYKNRTDGRIFGVIKLGGANMPRYGFKFSDKEHWDIVNYVRFLQGKNVTGMKRPQ